MIVIMAAVMMMPFCSGVGDDCSSNDGDALVMIAVMMTTVSMAKNDDKIDNGHRNDRQR